MTAMLQATNLSSTDAPPSGLWTASEFARFKDYMGDNWLPPADIGHNNPPSIGDPGSDLSYRIKVHIPEWLPRDKVRAFERALQEQGPYPYRLAALDQAAFRARANSSVSHRAFRLYDAVLDMSKGEHRCCLLDLAKLGYVAGIDGSNASSIIKELEEKPLIKALRFTEGKLGMPKAQKVLLAPIVTPEDRAKATSDRILAEADAAKIVNMERRAAAERRRYRERNPGSSDSYRNGQTEFPDRNGEFPDRWDNCLLNHIGKPQEEDDDGGTCAADATLLKAQVRPAPDTSVADATFIVREEHREEFRRLADTFGRRLGEMIISPTPRDTTDPILDRIVRNELGSYLRDHRGNFSNDLAEKAIGAALLVTSLVDSDGGSVKRLQRMVSFFEKALRSKAADIQRAEANRLADLRADHVVHQEKAEKRLRGVREGGNKARKSSASWTDIVEDFVSAQEAQ